MSGEHADMFLGLGGERIHGFTWGLRGFADSTLLFGMEGWRSWAFSEFCLVALSLNPEGASWAGWHKPFAVGFCGEATGGRRLPLDVTIWPCWHRKQAEEQECVPEMRP